MGLPALVAGMFPCAVPARADGLSGKATLSLQQKTALHQTQGWTSVIVRYNGDLTPEKTARLKDLHADVYRHLALIRSVAVSVPTRNLEALAALPFVEHLSDDLRVKKCDTFTVGHTGADVAFSQHGLDGTGVTVAVVDSGIDGADDLTSANSKSRVVGSTDFVGGSLDPCGHGTHVAGIIAGNGTDSTGAQCFQTFYGIARNVSLVSVKVLNQQGQGTVSDVVAGIQWTVANKAKYNIRVMNLSLGHPVSESYTTDPLCQAVESAWKSGIVVVCAAGNEGRLNAAQINGTSNEGWGTNYGSIQSPANDPYVITVGATKNIDGNRAHDWIATYSSRGPSRLDLVLKPDILAPGNRVISMGSSKSYLVTNYGATNSVLYSQYTTGNTNVKSGISKPYFYLSGTSMASPVVAGAAALLVQANPNLTPDTIKARLMFSADKWADPTGNPNPCTYGAGYLNIPAALACTAVPNQAATSPSMSIDTKGNVYINMDRAIWGTDINGSRAIWGVNGVTDLRAIWGSSANLLSASRAIWGSSVWSDRAIWGTSSDAVDLSSTAIGGE